MNKDTDSQTLKDKIRKLLAEQIGVESDDIKDDDSLTDDLHMGPHDLADFTQLLENSGVDTSRLDLSEVETVENLLEILSE